jgi:hypothetical protein
MRALSIRQPYAEQMLRGEKRFDYRSVRTNIRVRVYIYASARPASPDGGHLPRGVLVGTVEVFTYTGHPGSYPWHLRAPSLTPFRP